MEESTGNEGRAAHDDLTDGVSTTAPSDGIRSASQSRGRTRNETDEPNSEQSETEDVDGDEVNESEVDRAPADTDASRERTVRDAVAGHEAPSEPSEPNPFVASILETARDLNVDGRLFLEHWQKSADRRRAVRLEEKKLDIDLQRLQSEADLAKQEREARSHAEHSRIMAEVDAEHRRIEAQTDAAAHAAWVTRWEAIVRFALALLLVLGSLFVVAWGVIGDRDPEVVSQYAAPIAGLAGLAVGYFFSRAAK